MNSLKPWKRNNDTYENNEKARKAYEALLIVTAREPEYDQFRNFYLNIKEIAKAKFNYDYQLEEVRTLLFFFDLPLHGYSSKNYPAGHWHASKQSTNKSSPECIKFAKLGFGKLMHFTDDSYRIRHGSLHNLSRG